MAAITILTLVGSLRTGSLNRQLAAIAAQSAPDGVVVQIYEGLDRLPFYNEDLDTDQPPAAVADLRAAAARADAALVVTPEYNGGIPAVLKNAIDWLSRPYGDGALKGKPVAVIGAAAGRYGGVWAHEETRKSFGIAGSRVIDDITLSVPMADLEGRHPAEDAELAAALAAAVRDLAARAG